MRAVMSYSFVCSRMCTHNTIYMHAATFDDWFRRITNAFLNCALDDTECHTLRVFDMNMTPNESTYSVIDQVHTTYEEITGALKAIEHSQRNSIAKNGIRSDQGVAAHNSLVDSCRFAFIYAGLTFRTLTPQCRLSNTETIYCRRLSGRYPDSLRSKMEIKPLYQRTG